MAQSTKSEQRFLSDEELGFVSQSHHPALRDLTEDALRSLIKLLRDRRDRAGDIARRQRREVRGKAPPAGSRPATDDSGTRMKQTDPGGGSEASEQGATTAALQGRAGRTGRLGATGVGDEACQRRQVTPTFVHRHARRGNARQSQRARARPRPADGSRSRLAVRQERASPSRRQVAARQPRAHSSPSTSRIE